MILVKIDKSDNSIAKYPYTYGDLCAENNVSRYNMKKYNVKEWFDLTEAAELYELHEVVVEDLPEDDSQVWNISDEPVFENDQWVLKYIGSELIDGPTEINSNIADQLG
jgi:hypothetical protein